MRALSQAASSLTFKGDDGRLYTLDRINENLGAFLQLDDFIIQMVMIVK